jgi:phosphoglycerate dehydrogenase-like enzyme
MQDFNIVIAMTEDHTERTLPAPIYQQLNALGNVFHAPASPDPQSEDLAEILVDADVILTGTGSGMLDESILNLAPKLQAIVHAAGTVRPIVKDSVYDRGIRISSQAEANALPVAEYTLAMILLELKGVRTTEHTYRAARNAIDVDEILAEAGNYGRRIGIISASNIGRRVIELLQPFDLAIAVYDPYVDADAAAALGVAKMDLPELLSTSDLLSVHAPLLPETRGMIGAEQLSLLRDNAVLINTARGAVVNQDALLDELVTGRIRAVLDVTDPEIPAPESPLWTLENVVLTPHVAGSRGIELRRIGQRAVDEIRRLLRGEPLMYEVTRERYRTNA